MSAAAAHRLGTCGTCRARSQSSPSQWVQRNLRGPAYSLKALAQEESLSYGSLARKAREQSWRAQLEAERAALGERVAAEVRERTAIDQVEARLKHARIGDLVEPLLRDALQGLAHKVRGDPGALCVKDTVALGRLWTRLLEVGAGLQRGHDGAVQEVPKEVAANRRQTATRCGASPAASARPSWPASGATRACGPSNPTWWTARSVTPTRSRSSPRVSSASTGT